MGVAVVLDGEDIEMENVTRVHDALCDREHRKSNSNCVFPKRMNQLLWELGADSFTKFPIIKEWMYVTKRMMVMYEGDLDNGIATEKEWPVVPRVCYGPRPWGTCPESILRAVDELYGKR
jgi:hypothetical protein